MSALELSMRCLDMDGFWGTSIVEWTAYYTLATFGLLTVALVAAFYAWRQWRTTHRANLEANRPYVVVVIEPSPASGQLFDLVIRNIGRRPAFRVKTTLDPKPLRARETKGAEIANAKMLTDPIEMLAPNQELRTFYDSHADRAHSTVELPACHHVSITYRDSSKGRYSENSVLDLEASRGTMTTSLETVHTIGKTLKKIQQTLAKASVLQRTGSLFTESSVETRHIREQRLEDERLESEARHQQFLQEVGLAQESRSASWSRSDIPEQSDSDENEHPR